MKSFFRIFIFVLLLCSMLGCSTPPSATQISAPTSQATVTAHPSPQPAAEQPTTYPAPQSAAEQPTTYPGPQPTVEQPTTYPMPTTVEVIVVPTTVPNTGKVIGKVLLKGKPVDHAELGLAKVLKSQSGQELATEFDRDGAPRATTAQDGTFTIYNIPPGRYGLIYASLPETYLLLFPDKGTAILMTVEADKVVDLGVLDFTSMPK